MRKKTYIMQKTFPIGTTIWIGFIALCILSVTLCILSACEPEDSEPCCLGYTYYDDTAHSDDAFEQMCVNAMGYDEKHDYFLHCKLRDVDRYVDAAMACCAPLKAEIRTALFKDVVSSTDDWTAIDTKLLLPLLDEILTVKCDKYGYNTSNEIYDNYPYGAVLGDSPCGDNTSPTELDYRYQYRIPMNAYTWCLLNTNPRTYACDIERAHEFEKELQACCNDEGDSCITSYIKNNGECVNREEE